MSDYYGTAPEGRRIEYHDRAPTPPSGTLFVVAPSYQWFESWCRDCEIDPLDRCQVRYVREMRDVQGHRLSSEEQIIELGPFDPKRYELVLALAKSVRPG